MAILSDKKFSIKKHDTPKTLILIFPCIQTQMYPIAIGFISIVEVWGAKFELVEEQLIRKLLILILESKSW